MAAQASSQKRKEEEKDDKKEILKKNTVPKNTEQQKKSAAVVLKEIDVRTTQKVDAGKLMEEYLNLDFLKQGLGPSNIPKILSLGAVPKKGLSMEQAGMKVAHSYVRDNILGYLPSDIKPSQREIENAMGAVTKLVFDVSNASNKKETKKIG
jgi:hypothetical protein